MVGDGDARRILESGDGVGVHRVELDDEDSSVYLTVFDADHDTVATAALTDDEAREVSLRLIGASLEDPEGG